MGRLKEFLVARPRDTLSISVTGTACALRCAHCGGHYLSQMVPLEEYAAAPRPCKSCLISGGCTVEGRVPVLGSLERLKELKGSARYNFHVGLVSEEEIIALAPLADGVSFDFVGAESTIRNSLHLNKKVADYVTTFRLLRKYCHNVVPHILIGLEAGKLVGERKALDLLAAEGVEKIVFIVLIPTKGTEYESVKPPDLDEVLAFLQEARAKLPGAQLLLGCMRPGGAYRRRLDVEAVELGIDGIVQPVKEAVELARSKGYLIRESSECCIL